jgi:CRP/FNR family transcriptional regulator
MIDEEGREQILNFSKQGDILGLNGLLAKSHITESKALETSYLCSISISKYLSLASEHPIFYQALLEKMSRRIVEEEEHSLMLITKNTKQRIATFLVNLVNHNIECGLPNNNLTLHISRRDIGNYIGAAVETVSRILSQFQNKGIIEVHGKHIQIKDIHGLKTYVL